MLCVFLGGYQDVWCSINELCCDQRDDGSQTPIDLTGATVDSSLLDIPLRFSADYFTQFEGTFANNGHSGWFWLWHGCFCSTAKVLT